MLFMLYMDQCKLSPENLLSGYLKPKSPQKYFFSSILECSLMHFISKIRVPTSPSGLRYLGASIQTKHSAIHYRRGQKVKTPILFGIKQRGKSAHTTTVASAGHTRQLLRLLGTRDNCCECWAHATTVAKA